MVYCVPNGIQYRIRPFGDRTMSKPKTARADGPKQSIKANHPKAGVIRARIDNGLKVEAETILSKIGLNPSEAIRLYYKQITMFNGLPFAVKIPTPETVKAMQDADDGKVTRYASAAKMFEKMGI